MSGGAKVIEVKEAKPVCREGYLCNGCSLCAYRCPTGNIQLVEGAPVFGSECLACGNCIEACAHRALVLAAVG